MDSSKAPVVLPVLSEQRLVSHLGLSVSSVDTWKDGESESLPDDDGEGKLLMPRTA